MASKFNATDASSEKKTHARLKRNHVDRMKSFQGLRDARNVSDFKTFLVITLKNVQKPGKIKINFSFELLLFIFPTLAT